MTIYHLISYVGIMGILAALCIAWGGPPLVSWLLRFGWRK